MAPLETTLPIPFLISVAVPPGLANLDGLSRDEVSLLACPFFDAAPATVEKFQRQLGRHCAEFATHIDASKLEDDAAVVDLVDRGARLVFVQPDRVERLKKGLGKRVAAVVEIDGLDGMDEVEGVLVKNVDLKTVDVEALVKACAANKAGSLFLRPVEGTDLVEFVALAARCRAVPILPSTGLTTNPEDETKLNLARAIWQNTQSDRTDGLVPTVVCSEAGTALGLAYSSEASLAEALRTCTGVYQSRKRGLWVKGLTSGDTQELVRVALDCDSDALRFVVRQKGQFCHLEQFGCFGELRGLSKLESTLMQRKTSAPQGSYTARLFGNQKLLSAKIMEEAEELCDAQTAEQVAFEAADLMYFAMVKAVAAGVGLADIEASLDAKSFKVTRRQGDAKSKWAEKENITVSGETLARPSNAAEPKASPSLDGKIAMKTIHLGAASDAEVHAALKRPSQKSPDAILNIVRPIIDNVRANGDQALLSYTHQFEKATSLTSPVLRAPFPPSLMMLSPETQSAIDVSFANIFKFHDAQREKTPLSVETMAGVVCSRFARPIERVGLYVPGGTAVLPSTALMLGVPAMVAGCNRIVLASPPRADGSLTPEIVYVAHKVGAEAIVLAGGAQAVAALAYGTESVPKVDKILGPGNQFVTAAKMLVSNDTNAGVAIDMPAGPSEVLVIADRSANPAFVVSDLLSQAEHGVDSQVILVTIGLDSAQLRKIEDELHTQAMALPRVEIVRGAIAHSVVVVVDSLEDAMRISNDYAPEHLILQIEQPQRAVDLVSNAGSVFIGEWTPESVGDYSAGVNHSLRESYLDGS